MRTRRLDVWLGMAGCRSVVAAALLLACLAPPAAAQFDKGQIAGIVRDQQGGVIPGATVAVTSVQTQLIRTVVTDATGYYIVTLLQPGLYDVAIELSGFK